MPVKLRKPIRSHLPFSPDSDGSDAIFKGRFHDFNGLNGIESLGIEFPASRNAIDDTTYNHIHIIDTRYVLPLGLQSSQHHWI